MFDLKSAFVSHHFDAFFFGQDSFVIALQNSQKIQARIHAHTKHMRKQRKERRRTPESGVFSFFMNFSFFLSAYLI